MLQQTQVSRVIEKYREFVKRYPSVRDLARATTADILRVWKGIGYNRRALYLKKSAEIVTRIYRGKFPISETSLCKLPGVGMYTARAILVFAYKKDIAMVDTNIRKIITHFFFDDRAQKETIIQQSAIKLLPRGKSWEWHQALMDYSALELSNVKVQKPNVKKNSVPFSESNRFYRGRVIDILRDGSVERSALLRNLVLRYGRDEIFFHRIMYSLLEDGLVSEQQGMVRLPQ